MKRTLALLCLTCFPAAHAETAPAPTTAPRTAAPATAPKPGSVAPAPAPKPVATAPAAAAPAPAPAATRPAPTAPAAAPTRPAAAATAPAAAAATPAIPGATTAAPAQPAAPAPLTPEQRRQLELLANAERIDKANRELLARNQELQLNNENLDMQLSIIRHDKSSEGIWKGALAVIAGFLMGWFFATSSRRKSSW